MFAPTLFIGAMLGTAIGTLEQMWLPHLTGSHLLGANLMGPIGSYTLAGIGVLFAAFLRAPLTSVFMVLEVSGNYSIVAPVILANTVAYMIARKLDPVPIFEVFTRQEGLLLPSMEEVREEARLRIEDAMKTPQLPILPSSLALREVVAMAAANMVLIIQFADGSAYALKPEEAAELDSHCAPDCSIGDLLPADRLPQLFPDMPLDTTLHYFGRWPALLIGNRARASATEGILTEEEILNCFRCNGHAH